MIYKFFFTFVLIILTQTSLRASLIYKSNATGNWNSVSTWVTSTNGGASWDPAAAMPDAYNNDEIRIISPHTVTLTGNKTAGKLIIESGGFLNINSGIELEIVNESGTDLTLFGNGNITGAGTVVTASSGVTDLNLMWNSNFDVKLRVKSSAGSTNIFCSNVFYKSILKKEVTIDAGGTITCNGIYTVETRLTLTNNGTIGGTGILSAKGNIVNNSLININHLSIDSNLTISGTGANNFPTITIGIIKTLTLANDMSFNSSNIYCNGTILLFSGNSKNLTIPSACNIFIYSFGNINNGNFFYNGGNIDVQNGTMTTILNIVSGTANILNSLTANVMNAGTVNIFNGATLNILSGDTLKLSGTLTNNGTVAGSGTLDFKAAFINNYNLISVSRFLFSQGVYTILLGDTGRITSPSLIVNNNTTLYLNNHTLQSVNVNSGSTLRFDYFAPLWSIVKFKASNPIVISGTMNQNRGIIEYAGGPGQVITALNYRSLRINNPGGVIAGNNFNVTDSLTIISGDIDLNGREITLDAAAILTETSGNTVKGNTGVIKTTRTVSNPNNYNFGGLGLSITSSSNLGSTTVRRSHASVTINGYQSVIRNFDITPANNSGLNATLSFIYDESELNGTSESILGLFKSTNAGATYLYQGGTQDISGNKVTISGVNSFSRWTLSRSVYPANIKIILEGLYSPDKHNKKDSVKLYLRNSSAPYSAVDSAISEIDSLNFAGVFDFKNAPAGVYYFQIIHKNSIETWSRDGGEIYAAGISNSYDFTNADNKAFGNNLQNVNSTPVRFAVYSGDINKDGAVDLSDASLIENDAFGFVSGNVLTDLNGDGLVDLSDVVFADNNAANFVTAISP
ncbi:MAG TPA: hypothetical protein PK536_11040 [Ignavibacteria bacterium]|mgnify:CR=1 FL=1|nr:hypothetical protein [Bacteroidota bacterium]HRI85967.1 hypothetical protein [Ignavibacteria bacterium]HRK00419.1 hypothetical protein [Ignavibacteria bacterium]